MTFRHFDDLPQCRDCEQPLCRKYDPKLPSHELFDVVQACADHPVAIAKRRRRIIARTAG